MGKVGLIEATKGGYYKLPGGGIDKGETKEQALRRELIEEAGYEIGNINEFGYTVEYRCQRPQFPESGLRQVSYCYVVEAREYVGAALEEDEALDGFELVWMDIDEAIAKVSSVVPHQAGGSDLYGMQFYTLREKLILESYRQFLETKI